MSFGDVKVSGDPIVFNIMWMTIVVTEGIHLIFNRKGESMLEMSDLACRQDDDGQSHLHRLIVKA